MPNPNLFDVVHGRLVDARHSDLDKIASGAGVPVSTVRKIRYGEVTNPRIQTVQALYDFFTQEAECRVDSNVSLNPALSTESSA